jgi:hypothetical protein
MSLRPARHQYRASQYHRVRPSGPLRATTMRVTGEIYSVSWVFQSALTLVDNVVGIYYHEDLQVHFKWIQVAGRGFPGRLNTWDAIYRYKGFLSFSEDALKHIQEIDRMFEEPRCIELATPADSPQAPDTIDLTQEPEVIDLTHVDDEIDLTREEDVIVDEVVQGLEAWAAVEPTTWGEGWPNGEDGWGT